MVQAPPSDSAAALRVLRPKGGRSSVSGLTVAVFGATGFVGRYVVNRLGKIGSSVVVPYRGTERTFRELKVMGDLGQIAPVHTDWRRGEQLDAALRGVNVVVNLLGKHYPTKNYSLEDANLFSALSIAAAAQRAGIEKLVFVSALGAHATSRSDWASAKARAEVEIRKLVPTATVLRAAPVFGAEDRLLNRIGSFARYYPVYPQCEPEDALIQPLFVTDLATSIMACINDDTTKGMTYELGGASVLTRGELRDLVFHYTLSAEQRNVVPVSHELARRAAWWMEKVRAPRYSVAELDYLQQSLVVPDDATHTIADLHVQPERIERVAPFFLRRYKSPTYAGDVSGDLRRQ